MIHLAEVLLMVVLAALAILAVLACAYLGIALLFSNRLHEPGSSKRALRFDVIVPAHDEAAVIARSLASLRELDWPPEQFRMIVVADNCRDDTAAIARAAGARVLRRQDALHRGKGYALQFAFELSDRERWADAVVVVDADSQVSANLLEAFGARIERGACAIQARYGVLNPHASWRTRLMAIAQGSFHVVRSRARERLGVSCGIRGNGWCVTHTALESVPYGAFSLAEDLEYGIDLGLADFRVHYADEAYVLGEAASSSANATQQRQRWEQGRNDLRRHRTLELLAAAIRRPSRVCLDLALDLLVPSLSRIALMVAALVLGAALASWVSPHSGPLLWLGLACAGVLSLYVLRGWYVSGTGATGLLDLARAPVFVLWKAAVMARAHGAREWMRTERERS